EELKEEYDARVKILKRQQEEALEKGEETRTAVAGYSGLIGKTLKLSEKIFFGYESVKVNEVPSPTIPATVLAKRETKENTSKTSAEKPDDLTKIYFDYLEKLENNIESVDETVSDEEIFDIEEPVADILVDEDVIKNGDVVEEDLTETEDELIEFIEDDELLLEEKETLTPAEEIDADVVGIVEVIELPAEDGE
ncbi:hypothetical protein KAI65_06495, partial [Candidatus Parcubacteria bacterium]|nr:hypothetical protein [Candidatus Parcubacteria bacterium]